MQNVPIWHRILRIVSLLVVSTGIGLYVTSQYQSLLLAGLVFIALIAIDAICVWLILPQHTAYAHAPALRITHR
jgi:hypothetical protein